MVGQLQTYRMEILGDVIKTLRAKDLRDLRRMLSETIPNNVPNVEVYRLTYGKKWAWAGTFYYNHYKWRCWRNTKGEEFVIRYNGDIDRMAADGRIYNRKTGKWGRL